MTSRDTEELIAYQEGRYGSYEYGRYGNPTTRTLEEKIRVLEGAEDCLVSSSGMNSATTMLLALVPAGGHIVTTTDCYRRTRQFIQTVRPNSHISYYCNTLRSWDAKTWSWLLIWLNCAERSGPISELQSVYFAWDEPLRFQCLVTWGWRKNALILGHSRIIFLFHLNNIFSQHVESLFKKGWDLFEKPPCMNLIALDT